MITILCIYVSFISPQHTDNPIYPNKINTTNTDNCDTRKSIISYIYIYIYIYYLIIL